MTASHRAQFQAGLCCQTLEADAGAREAGRRTRSRNGREEDGVEDMRAAIWLFAGLRRRRGENSER